MNAAVRQALAEGLQTRLAGGAAVLPYGITGPFQPPAVVLGQPDVEFGDFLCSDKVTLGVAVVVREHPDGPSATQRDLESLWPQVADALKAMIHDDDSLGGLVTATRLTRSDFGDFQVQGQAYPAQQLTLEIHV